MNKLKKIVLFCIFLVKIFGYYKSMPYICIKKIS